MKCQTLVFALFCALTAAMTEARNISVTNGTNTSLYMDIKMKGAHPSEPDEYLCAGYDLTQNETYIVKFKGLATVGTAHHILLYGCENGSASSEDIWPCGSICKHGYQKIMFAWAKNAPATQFPSGVGMRIGKETSIKTIVIQVHYARTFTANETADYSGVRLYLSTEKPQYVAGVYLMVPVFFTIPPNETKYHVDISCTYPQNYTIVPFAFRTHAHNLGRVIVGYQHNSTGYHTIGKGNPMWPQTFYPSNASIEIKPGDSLVARCTFNSEGLNHTVTAGATGDDEMCNFYFMFYTEVSVPEPSGICFGVENRDLVDKMPLDSDVSLPSNPLLEAEAMGHHHYHHDDYIPIVTSPAPTTVESHVEVGLLSGQLQYQSDWSPGGLDIGQVGGVATDSDGNIYIFHRGNRTWETTSFDIHDNFQLKDQPIQQDTVLIFSPDGHLIRKFGKDLHYMPHGIEVDEDENIWLTDVALHQVFRIPKGGSAANLILGEKFVNGNDDSHFCKPTDVAVLKSGEFFVADGYCNSRILKFSKDGKLLKQWGEKSSGTTPGPSQFSIPHSVTVTPDMVCVADRENGRIQCFDHDGGFKSTIQHPQFGSALTAVEFCPLNESSGLLFAVNGGKDGDVKGFTFSLPDQILITTWNLPSPQHLTSPHDVAVDARGHAVYVGELNPPGVKKFVPQMPGNASVTPTVTPTSTTTTITTPIITPSITNVSGVSSSGFENAENSQLDAEEKENETVKGIEPDRTVKEESTRSLTPLLLIGPLIAIPVMLLMTFVISRFCREYRPCVRKSRNHGSQKTSHKGFDPLLQQVSEDSESENEMFLHPGRKVGPSD